MKTVNKTDTAVAKKAPVKGFRKLLQPLQASASDKENLVGAGRASSLKDAPDKPLSNLKELKVPPKSQMAITVEDLTSETPSDNYWELKCKKLTLALEETLKENRALHDRVKLLEEENELCKEQLYETANIVTVLTEIINEEKQE